MAGIIKGQKFGRLTALEPTDQRKNGCVVWECKCDCGKIIFVSTKYLNDGTKRSCGCMLMVDLRGQRFGKLVALEPTEQREFGAVVWECQCDCGNIVNVSATNLRNGHNKSCGCIPRGRVPREKAPKEKPNDLKAGNTKSCGCGISKRKLYKDLSGIKYGKLTVLEPTEQRERRCIVWKCKCDCGNIVFVGANRLTSGNVKSCGCMTKGRRIKCKT